MYPLKIRQRPVLLGGLPLAVVLVAVLQIQLQLIVDKREPDRRTRGRATPVRHAVLPLAIVLGTICKPERAPPVLHAFIPLLPEV